MGKSVLFCTGSRLRTASIAVLAALLALVSAGFAPTARLVPTAAGAEPEFVGVLALAVEDAAAKQLALTPRQRADLLDLIDRRESEALTLAIALKDLPPDQRREKLAPFRKESEERGLALLDEKQRAILSALWLKREGLAANQSTPATASGSPATGQAVKDAASEKSAAGKPADAKPAEVKSADGKLLFNFRFQPWAEVIPWFAKQADLSLVMDSPPPGTFNYTDTRRYTPAEALDVLNSVLLTKGYTLVRRERMLMVVNLEDGPIPPNLVPAVELKDLDGKGEFEVMSVLFTLYRLTPDDAETEIGKLIGPQGAIVKLPKARQIQITETGGRLRRIRTVLEAIEGPQSAIGVAADVPQLEVYSIASAEPQAVFDVLQTLLSGVPDVRLAVEPKSGNLVAFARPAQHATIRATIDQMQRDARKVEVIHLSRVDPQLAVLAINKLFGGDAKEGSSTAPKVDAEPTTRQLLIRGSEAQIAQIRQLLGKMGESPATDVAKNKSNVRMIPLKGRAAQIALEQAEQLWPTLRKNKVRVVAPASVAPALRGANSPASERLPQPGAPSTRPAVPSAKRVGPSAQPAVPSKQPAGKASPPKAADPPPLEPPSDPITLRLPRDPRFRLAGDTGPGGAADNHVPESAAAETGVDPAAQAAADDKEVQPEAAPPRGEPAPIVIAPSAGGVVIASEDTEALDQFEALLQTLAARTATSDREFTIFYLKSASATVIAETLGNILGGTTSSSRASGGGGSLLGDIAGAALGEGGGGIMGSLLGLGRGGGGGGEETSVITSGTMRIVPDVRLNALIVQGRPADLDSIEQLLEVLDQQDAPETLVAPKPRMIPVMNTKAADIAEVVKQVYQDRLSAGSNGQQPRQPSPEDFFRALRGGGRGGDRGGRGGTEEAQKMSIGVDTRTNSLVVSASQPLFDEVEHLVKTLDQATQATAQSMRVVTLKRSNPQSVHQALSAMMGSSVTTSRAPGEGQDSQRSRDGRRDSGGDENRSRDEMERIRARMEFFNNMQRFGGGGRGGDSRGGDFGGGRGGSGGFGRGGGDSGGGRGGDSSGGGRGSRDGR